MCPIYIEAVIQISRGPQNLKEGRLQALKCSQEWKMAYPTTHSCGIAVLVGIDWEKLKSFSRPAEMFANQASFEANLQGWVKWNAIGLRAAVILTFFQSVKSLKCLTDMKITSPGTWQIESELKHQLQCKGWSLISLRIKFPLPNTCWVTLIRHTPSQTLGTYWLSEGEYRGWSHKVKTSKS